MNHRRLPITCFLFLLSSPLFAAASARSTPQRAPTPAAPGLARPFLRPTLKIAPASLSRFSPGALPLAPSGASRRPAAAPGAARASLSPALLSPAIAANASPLPALAATREAPFERKIPAVEVSRAPAGSRAPSRQTNAVLREASALRFALAKPEPASSLRVFYDGEALRGEQDGAAAPRAQARRPKASLRRPLKAVRALPAVALALLAVAEPAFAAGTAGAPLGDDYLFFLARLSLGMLFALVLFGLAHVLVDHTFGRALKGEKLFSTLVLVALSGALLGALAGSWTTLGGAVASLSLTLIGFSMMGSSSSVLSWPWKERLFRALGVVTALSAALMGILFHVFAGASFSLLAGAFIGMSMGLVLAGVSVSDMAQSARESTLRPFLLFPLMLAGAWLGASPASFLLLLAALGGFLITLFPLTHRAIWGETWRLPRTLVLLSGALAAALYWHFTGNWPFLAGTAAAMALHLLTIGILSETRLDAVKNYDHDTVAFRWAVRRPIKGHPSIPSLLFSLLFTLAGGWLASSAWGPALVLGALCGLLLGFLAALPSLYDQNNRYRLPFYVPYLPLVLCLTGALTGVVLF